MFTGFECGVTSEKYMGYTIYSVDNLCCTWWLHGLGLRGKHMLNVKSMGLSNCVDNYVVLDYTGFGWSMGINGWDERYIIYAGHEMIMCIWIGVCLDKHM